MGDIDTGSKMPEFQIMKAEISRYVTLKELRKACMKNYDRFYNRDSAKDVKIWKMNKDMNPKKYHEIVKKAAHPQMKDSYKLKLAYGTQWITQGIWLTRMIVWSRIWLSLRMTI